MVLSSLLLLGSLTFTTGISSGDFNFSSSNYSSKQYLDTSSINLLTNRDINTLVFKINTESNLSSYKLRLLGLPNQTSKWYTFTYSSDNTFIYNYTGNDVTTLTSSLQLELPNNTSNVNVTFSSIDLYMLNSTSANLGTSILDSIKSGLNLMEDIASEFLTGFTNLFWKENDLTIFGQFSLIFLGISITFSIIKLCLNLIRGKTGA